MRVTDEAADFGADVFGADKPAIFVFVRFSLCDYCTVICNVNLIRDFGCALFARRLYMS
jgi:hypothetical protein